MAIQLDFFLSEEQCHIDFLKKSVEDIKKSSDKVRKGTYARLNELNKECTDLKCRLEIIERHICRV